MLDLNDQVQAFLNIHLAFHSLTRSLLLALPVVVFTCLTLWCHNSFNLPETPHMPHPLTW